MTYREHAKVPYCSWGWAVEIKTLIDDLRDFPALAGWATQVVYILLRIVPRERGDGP